MRRDSDMKKVVKFGGSSLASARQFKKVGDIIRADKSRRYVIPSAPGKRNSKDTKVTDMLYECYAAASTGASYKKLLEAIKARYQEIIDGLDLNLNLDHETVSLWRIISVTSSLTLLRSFSLMRTAILRQSLPTRSFPSVWSI